MSSSLVRPQILMHMGSKATKHDQDNMPASRGVLETVELLELIIAGIPMIHVFRLQRVSKLWNAVIARSQKIQRLLFAKPQTKPVSPRVRIRTSNGDYSLAYRRPLSIFRLPKSSVFTPVRKSNRQYEVRNSFAIAKSEMHKTRSYNDLFITQPPCTIAKIGVGVLDEFSKSQKVVYCSIRQADGLTFSHVKSTVDMIMRTNESVDSKYFSVSVCVDMPVSQDALDRWTNERAQIPGGSRRPRPRKARR